MANVKISALPSYTGSAADLRWFVMNNSGETETYKYSGYSSQLIPGTGTDSYRTINSTGSTGTRAIAIGKGSSAGGTDSVSIGDITGNNLGAGSINIGKHGQVAGDYAIAIGNAAFVSGSDSISIGRETAAYNGGIVLGGNISRATSIGSIVIGNSNERNLGAGYSSIMGYGNKVGDAPNFNPGPYNNIIASFSVINGDNSTIGYNNIFGGMGNYITGTTSGATMIGCSGLTSVGTDSISIGVKSKAFGSNSVAIGGNAATNGDDAVSIGNGYNVAISAGAVSIGRHPGLGAGKLIAIGSGAYISGDNSIAIGHETASSNNGIVLGGTTSRAGGGFSITLGNGNEHNLGAYSTILGTNNLIANFFYNSVLYSNGGTYNNIYSNNSKIGFTGVTNFTGNTIIGGNNNVILAEGSNNIIIGGGGNSITGTTSGATLVGMSDYSPTRNDATFAMAYVMTNYSSYNFADDTAAAAGGVVLGQMYHNNGAMRIRIV